MTAVLPVYHASLFASPTPTLLEESTGMKSRRSLTAWVLLVSAVSVHAQGQAPSPSLVLNPMTAQGCFSSSEPMQDQGSYMYQSSGYCQKQCAALGKPVMATTQGSNCWCGDLLPAANSKVADDQCDSPCNGFNKETCRLTCSIEVQPCQVLRC